MRFVPVLLALACLCLISGMATAHDDEYSADENHNGYLEVYRSSNYHGGWHHYRVVANRKLRNHAPNEPRIRMVWSKAKAELWIHKVEMEGRHCAGHSEEVPRRPRLDSDRRFVSRSRAPSHLTRNGSHLRTS